MIKRISYLLLLLVPFLLGCTLYWNSPRTVEAVLKPTVVEEPVQEEINYEEYINNLKIQYGNQDIIAILEFPNVFEELVVQTNNNDYYLTHTATHEERSVGATFLDYRVNLYSSKKLLIYSHSDQWDQLPFTNLKKYNDKDYFNQNPYIYLIDSTGKHKYEVFSSYIEAKDFDYVNVENFGGLTYQEHLEKLRKKSFVSKKIELTEETKVLVLQTCSFDSRVSGNHKYQILVAKLVEE